MLNKMKSLHRDKRGITGLETAIILIAFVVVASVFAYTVISAGMFSSQKGQEVIHSGLEEARTTIALKGDVVVKDTDSDDDLDEVIFTVVSIADGEPVDLTEPTDTTPADGLADTGSGNVAVISYVDAANRYTDLAWTTTVLGKGDAEAGQGQCSRDRENNTGCHRRCDDSKVSTRTISFGREEQGCSPC
jgi:flagellin-like protein